MNPGQNKLLGQTTQRVGDPKGSKEVNMSALKRIQKEGDLIALLPARERNGKGRPCKFEAWTGTAGNFTFVLIENQGGKYIGVSKRNPVDKDAGTTGLQIAVVRAYRSMKGLPDEDVGYCRQRPVTRKQARVASARDLILNAYERKQS